MRSIPILLTIILLAVGCILPDPFDPYYYQPDDITLDLSETVERYPRYKGEVEVYYDAAPSNCVYIGNIDDLPNCEIIGTFHITGHSTSGFIKKLKRRAAGYGANAIVIMGDVKHDWISELWLHDKAPYEMSAWAIRIKDENDSEPQ